MNIAQLIKVTVGHSHGPNAKQRRYRNSFNIKPWREKQLFLYISSINQLYATEAVALLFIF